MYKLPHESQGLYPVCTAMSVLRAFEWLVEHETGERVEFSVKQAYIEAGGTTSGVSTAQVIKVLRTLGAIENDENPFFPYEKQTPDWVEKWQELAELNKHKERWVLSERITVASKVRTDEDRKRMEHALKDYGPLVVTVNATDGWYKGQLPSGKKWKRLHGIVIVGRKENGNWIGLNSWNELSDNGAEVELHKDYPFAFVYALNKLEKLTKTICQ